MSDLQQEMALPSWLIAAFNALGADSEVARNLAAGFQELREQASRDGLTGLYNQANLLPILGRKWAEKERENTHKFAFVSLDLDGFKDINDNLGHPCGDSVLVSVAKALKSISRDTDIVIRQGGDEFSIVMPYDDHEQKFSKEAVEKHIRAALEGVLFDNDTGKDIFLGVSLGIVCSDEEGINSVDDMLKRADEAMYKNKGDATDLNSPKSRRYTDRKVKKNPLVPVLSLAG